MWLCELHADKYTREDRGESGREQDLGDLGRAFSRSSGLAPGLVQRARDLICEAGREKLILQQLPPEFPQGGNEDKGKN